MWKIIFVNELQLPGVILGVITFFVIMFHTGIENIYNKIGVTKTEIGKFETEISTTEKQVYDKFDVVDMKILSRRILKEEIPILENFKDKLNLISKNFYSDNKKFRNVKNAKLVSDFLLSAKFALKSWNEKYLELITILKAEAMDLYNKNKKESENYNWGEFKKLFMSEVNLLKETSTLVTPLKKRLGILIIIEEYGQRKIGQIIDEFKHPILVMSIFLLLFAVRNSYGQEWKLIEVGDNLTEESKTDSTNNEAFLPICQLLKDNDLFKEIINRKIHLQYWKVDTVKENNGAAAIFIPSFLGTGGIIKYTDPRYLEKEDSIYFKYILYHEYVHVMQEENIKNYFVAKTLRLENHLIVDLDSKSNILGIELLNAKSQLTPSFIKQSLRKGENKQLAFA